MSRHKSGKRRRQIKKALKRKLYRARKRARTALGQAAGA
jgi:hypothetical protein